MFKTKKEFIQAMLDGRRFRSKSGIIFDYNEKITIPFNHGMYFDAYDTVVEIMPEPDAFEPEEGVEIIVWDNNDGNDYRRVFIGMFNHTYMCEPGRARGELPIAWQYAKPIPEENPWIKHDGKSWPSCKPTDKIEYKRKGYEQILIARAGDIWWEFRNTNADIIEWRLNK